MARVPWLAALGLVAGFGLRSFLGGRELLERFPDPCDGRLAVRELLDRLYAR